MSVKSYLQPQSYAISSTQVEFDPAVAPTVALTVARPTLVAPLSLSLSVAPMAKNLMKLVEIADVVMCASRGW